MEITLAIWDADQALAGDEVLDTLEEKFNIDIIPINITWDDYEQKIKMWAASGTLPDLFVGDFRNSLYYPKWIQQGLIHEIPQDLSAYPHLKEYLSAPFAEEAKFHGSLYCIPRKSYPSQAWTSIDRMICYRWDLARKAGVTKEPETWREFQAMIQKIIEADPEGMGIRGLTSAHKNLLNGVFMPYACPIALDSGSVFRWVEAADGTYQPAYFCEDLLPGFHLAREFYESGVIDPEIIMTTNASANEGFLKGENAAIAISGGFGNKYLTIGRYWEEYHEGTYMEDVKALGLMPDKDGKKAYSVYGYAWSESYINGAAEEEKVDKILQVYDYLLTEEGAFFTTYGPKGELYDVRDGKVALKDREKDVGSQYPSTSALSQLVRWLPSEYDSRFPPYWPLAYNQVDKERAEEAGQIEIPKDCQECSKVMMELGIGFSIHAEEDFLAIMAGSRPVEEMWEEIVRQYEQEGLQDVIRKVNEALGDSKEGAHCVFGKEAWQSK